MIRNDYRDKLILPCIDDMARLMMQVGDPLGKLSGVGDSGGQKDVVHVVRQQDDGLLPHHASLLVSHVMDLVKYYPSNLEICLFNFWEYLG